MNKPHRPRSLGTEHTHQVVPTGDGQGERGVATPQQVGVRPVGEKELHDISGTLWEWGQKSVRLERPRAEEY